LGKQTEKPADRRPRAEQKLSRVALTGFMGAGKSTVGAILAAALGWQFLDLDCVIEAECRKTVAQIFHDHGEAYFREKERQTIQDLGKERKIVLALGGGAIEDPSSLAHLVHSPETCLVFLDAPLPELLVRIGGGAGTRPLLTAFEDLEARHQRRLPLYRSADLTVLTSGLSPREVADLILERLNQDWQVEGRRLDE
jgi:shikimate kinase